ATDIALSIDAVEILLTRRIDTFVIIASDSDFAPLARRINEEGKDVFGYGNRSTPDAFRRACTEFQEFSLLALQSSLSTPTDKLGSRLPADAEALLLAALTELGWAECPISLPDLGQHLAQQHPGFNSRIYSCRNLTELLLSLPSVELAEIDGQRRVRPARAKIRTG
ncbi:MAG: NYN domain-containing protein, partial [Nitrococcus sp.]|nr:NYN domain-containing protein [Nitrococcus sp.]